MARLLMPARRFYLPSVSLDPVPNVSVNNLAQLEAAIAATPSGAGDYIIRMNSGTYGRSSALSGFNRAGTRLRLQGDRNLPTSQWPVSRGFSAAGARDVSLEFLVIEGNALDQWGFPTGASSGADATRGVLFDDGAGIRLWGCLFKKFSFNIQFRNATDFEIGWCTIREWAIDGCRTFATNPNIMRNVHKHHTEWDISAESGTPYPDLSSRGLSYVNDRRVAVDPRRSDQKWTSGDYVNAPVMDLAGNMIPCSETYRNGRHPDCDQTAGPLDNYTWTDCLFTTNNLYCHGSYNNNADDGGWAASGGLAYTRCEFSTAHNHAMAWQGDYSGGIIWNGVWIRGYPTRTWALNRPGVTDEPGIMRPGPSTVETIGSPIQNIGQTISFSPASTAWWRPEKVTGNPVVFSNTGTPLNWASTDVGSRNIGHLRAPMAP